MAFVVLLVTGLVACSGGSSSPREVGVQLKEWSLTLSPEEVADGRVRFLVTNAGSLSHELLVVKSDLPAAELPITERRADLTKVNVEGGGDRLVAPGETLTLDFHLSDGKYVLLCNLLEATSDGPPRGHYQSGVYASFYVGS